MTTFRVHYDALEAPRILAGERLSVDLDTKSPDDARRRLSATFEQRHPGCRPHIHKIKRLKEAGR